MENRNSQQKPLFSSFSVSIPEQLVDFSHSLSLSRSQKSRIHGNKFVETVESMTHEIWERLYRLKSLQKQAPKLHAL